MVVISMDDWGIGDYKDKKESRLQGIQWGKVLLSLTVFVGILSLLFYGFYPKNSGVSDMKKEDTHEYNVAKKEDNYGYPDNVTVPEEAKRIVSLYDEVGQDVSDSDKAKLQAMRDSVSVHEAGWDVSLLGSRKFIDYTQPAELELALLDSKSVIAKLIENAKTIGSKDVIPDGSYILINPLDEAQMYWKRDIYEVLGSKKYINDLSLVYVTDTTRQNILANYLLYAAGYGKDVDDMYPIEYRVRNVKDYPMFLTVKNNTVVAKKTKVNDFKSLLVGWK